MHFMVPINRHSSITALHCTFDDAVQQSCLLVAYGHFCFAQKNGGGVDHMIRETSWGWACMRGCSAYESTTERLGRSLQDIPHSPIIATAIIVYLVMASRKRYLRVHTVLRLQTKMVLLNSIQAMSMLGSFKLVSTYAATGTRERHRTRLWVS